MSVRSSFDESATVRWSRVMLSLRSSVRRLLEVPWVVMCVLLANGGKVVGAMGATIGLNFTGFTQLANTDYPPDTMGAVEVLPLEPA